MKTVPALFLKWFVAIIRFLTAQLNLIAARLELAYARLKIASIPGLSALVRRFQESPESGWTIGLDDALNLYRLVLKYRPERILELGTGIGFSTAVMALALSRVGRGSITTLEQSPKCRDIAEALIPRELKERIKFIIAAPKVFQVEGTSRLYYFCGYDWIPAEGEVFDFVFVDGPGGWSENGELVALDQGDVFRLMRNLSPGCGVYIDGRRQTAKKISRYLWRYLKLVEQSGEHAVFERNTHPIARSGSIEIADRKLSHGKSLYSDLP